MSTPAVINKGSYLTVEPFGIGFNLFTQVLRGATEMRARQAERVQPRGALPPPNASVAKRAIRLLKLAYRAREQRAPNASYSCPYF